MHERAARIWNALISSPRRQPVSSAEAPPPSRQHDVELRAFAKDGVGEGGDRPVGGARCAGSTIASTSGQWHELERLEHKPPLFAPKRPGVAHMAADPL
eukprot:CAMPEP_0119374408 /NCGR_PEP_ID=MMETSP1334-20130426/30583_1 /TAXON_ID=127549 /ORGANISM="Calcidiscus leptoporus, Strain RCC1130" /LENGTH=98 /DNA_ID=CAMNT_0007392475 /DNA_START=311 /DNA_END=608 /DNA_ORIENTATION=-